MEKKTLNKKQVDERRNSDEWIQISVFFTSAPRQSKKLLQFTRQDVTTLSFRLALEIWGHLEKQTNKQTKKQKQAGKQTKRTQAN